MPTTNIMWIARVVIIFIYIKSIVHFKTLVSLRFWNSPIVFSFWIPRHLRVWLGIGTIWIKFRFNSSFSPLTFSKLRFWSFKKKTTKLPSKFCTCSSFDPQGQFWLSLHWRDTLREVPRFFFLPWGAKTATVAKFRGRFCSFFLGGQNRNFVKVRGWKLLLSLKFI